MDFKPFPFDPVNDALLLAAAGYTHEFVPADWQDVGGPESGPKLSGHPDLDVWTRPGETKYSEHVIVVVGGMVVDADTMPAGPDGWEDQF